MRDQYVGDVSDALKFAFLRALAQREAAIAATQLTANAARKAREAECEIRGARCRERETDERTTTAADGPSSSLGLRQKPYGQA